jgi:hypothetical protein
MKDEWPEEIYLLIGRLEDSERIKSLEERISIVEESIEELNTYLDDVENPNKLINIKDAYLRKILIECREKIELEFDVLQKIDFFFSCVNLIEDIERISSYDENAKHFLLKAKRIKRIMDKEEE